MTEHEPDPRYNRLYYELKERMRQSSEWAREAREKAEAADLGRTPEEREAEALRVAAYDFIGWFEAVFDKNWSTESAPHLSDEMQHNFISEGGTFLKPGSKTRRRIGGGGGACSIPTAASGGCWTNRSGK
jgi:hypothetical protein